MNVIVDIWMQTPTALLNAYNAGKRRFVLKEAMQKPVKSAPPTPPEVHMLPGWLRDNISGNQIDRAFNAGAALVMFSSFVKASPPYLGCLSERLAFQAAVATNRSSGRTEDEEAIRDQWLLRPRSEELPPAARVFSVWAALARLRGGFQALSPDVLSSLAEGFGAPLNEAPEALLAALQPLVSASGNPVKTAATVSAAFYAHEPHHEAVAHLLADLVLSQRLGWDRPLPLVASSIAAPVLRDGGARRRPLPSDPGWEMVLSGAYVLSVERTFQMAAHLSRKASILTELTPKLRAKHSDQVAHALLDHAFLPSSRVIAGMSDRAMRRIFDRLVRAGAVREVSGRSSFRIYGL